MEVPNSRNNLAELRDPADDQQDPGHLIPSVSNILNIPPGTVISLSTGLQLLLLLYPADVHPDVCGDQCPRLIQSQ